MDELKGRLLDAYADQENQEGHKRECVLQGNAALVQHEKVEEPIDEHSSAYTQKCKTVKKILVNSSETKTSSLYDCLADTPRDEINFKSLGIPIEEVIESMPNISPCCENLQKHPRATDSMINGNVVPYFESDYLSHSSRGYTIEKSDVDTEAVIYSDASEMEIYQQLDNKGETDVNDPGTVFQSDNSKLITKDDEIDKIHDDGKMKSDDDDKIDETAPTLVGNDGYDKVETKNAGRKDCSLEDNGIMGETVSNVYKVVMNMLTCSEYKDGANEETELQMNGQINRNESSVSFEISDSFRDTPVGESSDISEVGETNKVTNSPSDPATVNGTVPKDVSDDVIFKKLNIIELNQSNENEVKIVMNEDSDVGVEKSATLTEKQDAFKCQLENLAQTADLNCSKIINHELRILPPENEEMKITIQGETELEIITDISKLMCTAENNVAQMNHEVLILSQQGEYNNFDEGDMANGEPESKSVKECEVEENDEPGNKMSTGILNNKTDIEIEVNENANRKNETGVKIENQKSVDILEESSEPTTDETVASDGLDMLEEEPDPILALMMKLECPFTWKPDKLCKTFRNKNNLVTSLVEREKDFQRACRDIFREFIIYLVLAYERCSTEDALDDLRRCHELITLFTEDEMKDHTEDRSVEDEQINKDTCEEGNGKAEKLEERADALRYILAGSTLFTLKEKYESDSLEFKPEINIMEFGSVGTATILAVKAAVLSEYGYDGNHLSFELFKEAVELDPEYWQWKLYYGKAIERRLRLTFYGKEDVFFTLSTKQIKNLKEASELRPDNASLLIHLGNAYRHYASQMYRMWRLINNSEIAVRKPFTPEETERLKPFKVFDSEDTFETCQMNLFKKACACFEKALKIEQYSPNVISRCAHALGSLPYPYKNAELAAEGHKRALIMAPDNSMVNHYAGLFYERMGNYKMALELYECAVAANKLNFTAEMSAINLRMCRSDDEMYSPVVRLHHLLRKYPEKATKVQTLAHMGFYFYKIEKQMTLAVRSFYEALKSDPESQYLRNFVPWKYYDTKDYSYNVVTLLQEIIRSLQGLNCSASLKKYLEEVIQFFADNSITD